MPVSMLKESMQDCIDTCRQCHEECLRSFAQHCLIAGGEHLEAEHARLMLSCAEICQAAANVMLTGAEIHPAVCRACADVCDACAESCERVGDMQRCVEACRHCASSCHQMAA
jgi:hypothetical protein